MVMMMNTKKDVDDDVYDERAWGHGLLPGEVVGAGPGARYLCHWPLAGPAGRARARVWEYLTIEVIGLKRSKGSAHGSS